MTAKKKTQTPMDRTTSNRKAILKSPYLLMSVIAGLALMVGVVIGNSGASGPAQSQAANLDNHETKTERTPAIEPVKQPHNMKESLVVSDNTGIVNVGGTHYHQLTHRTPAKPTTVTRFIEVPVPVIVIRDVATRPKRIWARRTVPNNSRLGRTLSMLQRFENAGVQIVVEN